MQRDPLGLDFTDYREQQGWLRNAGLDDVSVKRLGVEIHGRKFMQVNGFHLLDGLTRAVIWRLRDSSGHATGKVWARAWWDKERRHNAEWLVPAHQPRGLYYSPASNWSEIGKGDQVEIYDNPLDADVAAVDGRYAVAVLGEWGWKTRTGLLAEFDQLPWRQCHLTPICCFNAKPGGRGWNAVTQMAAMFHVKHQVNLVAFHDGELVPVEDELTDHLSTMATEVCVVKDISRFLDIETGALMSRTEFESISYAARQVPDMNGAMTSVAKAYTLWPDRTEVQSMVYKPGKPRLKAGEYYNLWKGMGVEPVEGDVSLMLDWCKTILPDEREREWFLNWWAWQFQNLGQKLTSAMILVGPPGIGKGWWTYIIERIYGTANVAKISLPVLQGNFNAEIAAKQLVVVEESDELGFRGATIYNKIKDMITSTTIRREPKGVDAHFIENVINVFLTGNQIGIFKLDRDDRRMGVLKAAGRQIANDPSYWQPRWDWASQGGAEAVYHYLLHRDLSDFDGKGMAIMTPAKREMCRAHEAPEEGFLRDLKEVPDQMLDGLKGSVAMAKELVWVMEGRDGKSSQVSRSASMSMASALRREGYELAHGGNQINARDVGLQGKFYVIRPLDEPPTTLDGWRKLITERSGWK